MELSLSSEDAAFRDEVRAFIAENYPQEMRVPNLETDLTKEQMLLWHRILPPEGIGSRRSGRRNMAGRAGRSPNASSLSRRRRVLGRCRRWRSA